MNRNKPMTHIQTEDMSLITSDFDNSLMMKSKWVYIDASIKKEESWSSEHTAKEKFYRENLVGRNPVTLEVWYGYIWKDCT